LNSFFLDLVDEHVDAFENGVQVLLASFGWADVDGE
jgi:hypothetical protein